MPWTADVPKLGGHPIIDADTEILGGVFIARNSIYVDFEENPGPYEKVYDEAEELLSGRPELTPLEMVRVVSDVVGEAMPYCEDARGLVLKREAKARGMERLSMTDQVNLSEFIREGGGLCTQKALLFGTIVRLLQDRLDIGGEVSIEPPEAPTISHVWSRYARGQARIISDSKPYVVAELSELPDPERGWYLRPGEEVSLSSPEDSLVGAV
jgi:hypothetical protein